MRSATQVRPNVSDIDVLSIIDPNSGEKVQVYAILPSKVVENEIIVLGISKVTNLRLRTGADMRDEFKPKPFAPFVPVAGMFVTNNNGRVWYYNGEDYYPTDGGIPLFTIDKAGLREVTLQDGRKFREIVEG